MGRDFQTFNGQRPINFQAVCRSLSQPARAFVIDDSVTRSVDDPCVRNAKADCGRPLLGMVSQPPTTATSAYPGWITGDMPGIKHDVYLASGAHGQVHKVLSHTKSLLM